MVLFFVILELDSLVFDSLSLYGKEWLKHFSVFLLLTKKSILSQGQCGYYTESGFVLPIGNIHFYKVLQLLIHSL